MKVEHKCPACNYKANKVMYAGVPMMLCEHPDRHLYGIGAWILDVIPFNGYFIQYEGSYWVALYHFIIGDHN